jgi:putative hydrolase of the HAD superfamily
VLAVLKDVGMSVAVLTDGPLQVQQNKVDALGLEALVDAVVLTDVGNGRNTWKPSPWGYETLERRFGAANYVYVADNVEKDFVTARILGWYTIELRRNDRMYSRRVAGPEYEADQSIRDIADLLDLWMLGARNA